MDTTERLRRTMLYVPGNNPGMLQNAHIYGSDSVVFDLEDAVSADEKDAARRLVYNALTMLDFGDSEMVVRINDYTTDIGQKDIAEIVKTKKAVIRMPKAETAEDIKRCSELIGDAEKKNGIPIGSTKMIASLETAAGVLNAREIAVASPRLIAISLGAEDFVTDLRTTRSPEGTELLFARSSIVLAARAAGIQAIDTVYTDVENEEGLLQETKLIKQLGFDGKSVVNPKQIDTIHAVFAPTSEEIAYAKDVIDAIETAKQQGSGVASLRGKMIDKPIVIRAKHLLRLAKATGAIKEEIQIEQ